MARPRLAVLAAVCSASLLAAASVQAANFVLINLDSAGEGFNDPTPVAPIGGNPGTTLGQQRLNVFQAACTIWGQTLPTSTIVRVQARFDPLTPCDATSGVLGSAGAINAYSDFPGALIPNTWYHSALANRLNGGDLDATANDINARFNTDVDNGTCLGTTNWYYGYDHNEGTNIDLLAVVLHEIGHGLGFQTFTTLSTGQFASNRPDIFSRFLFDRTFNDFWPALTNNQRKSSSINTNQLVWGGTNVTQNANKFLGASGFVHVDSPAAISGDKEFGTAEFGPPLGSPPIQGEVVVVDDAVGTTTDACEPLVNAAQLAGKIAYIDRGICTFLSKAQAAQAAGAIAVIIGNNVAGPPPGMSGVDPSMTIPTVSITLDDGVAIQDQILQGQTVTVSLGTDPAHLAGTDVNGRVKMYAPNPLELGSSVSHWDVTAQPNLLMEPFIEGDLTNVDLTQYQMADIGWLGNFSGVAENGVTPAVTRAFSAPNPFSNETSIRFQLVHSGQVGVEVYDVRGTLVKRIPFAWHPAGPQAVDWDGTDAGGRRAPAGVYFWRVVAGAAAEPALPNGRVVRVN